jgi:hypothetical protein
MFPQSALAWQQSFNLEQLGVEDRGAGRAADCVVPKNDEFRTQKRATDEIG